MFNHIMLGTNDLEKSHRFYDALLGALGVPPGVANKNRYFWRGNGGTFSVSTPINGEPATAGNGSTMGFVNFGEVEYVSHHGSQPMSITWQLKTPMPHFMWKQAAKLAVG